MRGERGIDAARADFAGVADYDQWSVPNGYDDHRPLYRIALNDPAATELYVSSATGEVVLGTTRFERVWNYLGQCRPLDLSDRPAPQLGWPGTSRCGRCRWLH